jgi:IQ domain-containing protein H
MYCKYLHHPGLA